MPLFEVIGVGKDTHRQRKRCYSAATEEIAIEKAVADGILATKVIPLPPEPASESQISYARSLGVSIPENPNLEQMSDLISQKVDGIADSWLVARARNLGADLDPAKIHGLGYVSRSINLVLARDPAVRNQEMAFWYLHSVYRHRCRGSWSSPYDSGLNEETVRKLAADLVSNPRALKSMLRDYRNETYYDFLPFGDGSGGTLNTHTIAYGAAVALFEDSPKG
jgi:hypothetical protein